MNGKCIYISTGGNLPKDGVCYSASTYSYLGPLDMPWLLQGTADFFVSSVCWGEGTSCASFELRSSSH